MATLWLTALLGCPAKLGGTAEQSLEMRNCLLEVAVITVLICSSPRVRAYCGSEHLADSQSTPEVGVTSRQTMTTLCKQTLYM